MNITVLSASVRVGRNSHRAALFFKKYLEERIAGEVGLIDLDIYQFPIFQERLRYLKSPSSGILDFAMKIKMSDGIIMVTPEYNGGYPASLKNVIDLLYDEWYKKPIGLVTVSNGSFAGTQVTMGLQFILWKMKAWVIPAMFPIPKVQETFDEQGNAQDFPALQQRTKIFIDEFFWCIEAKKRMGTL
ncbi:MAG: NAD(P)H-dependent oxidoreductase [Flavisolibacter sp.]